MKSKYLLIAAATLTAFAVSAQDRRTGTTPPSPTNPRIVPSNPGVLPPNQGFQQNPGTIPQNPAGTTPGTAPGTTPRPGVGVAPQRPETQFGFTNRFGFPSNEFGLQTNRFGGFITNEFGLATNRFGGFITNQFGMRTNPIGLPIGSNVLGIGTDRSGTNAILLPTGRREPTDVNRNPSGAPEGGMTDPIPGPGGVPR